MRSSRVVTAALALLLSAQTAPPTMPAWIEQEGSLEEQGRYLAATDLLHAAAFDANGDVRDRMAFQFWTQSLPFITGELPLRTYDRVYPAKPDPAWSRRLAAATPRDAIAEIVRRARATSIVVLNEAHVSPRDRAFALEVARALRPLGYTILAAEAFDTDAVAALRRDGVVRRSLGFYTRDPVYAGFVRQALALGYRPIAYDTSLSPTNAREEAAAANLMKQVPTPDRGAKLLVYVGHSHVMEAPQPDGTEWLASRLKRLTGIDPLTVDQTIVEDIYPVARAAYDTAASRIGDRSAVFVDAAGPVVLGMTPQDVDLQVVHPRRAERDGRPTWLSALGGKPLAIPHALLPTRGRALIQAFAADAPADAVPLDQILVTAGTPPPTLLVPDLKTVRLAVETAD